jgi:vacuolar-type H+-ATPase subunit E/Vma4
VRCQAAFAPLLRAAIARHNGAELVIDESVGPGIVAEADDRSVIVDNTLVARLERAEAHLAIELSRKLSDGRQ